MVGSPLKVGYIPSGCRCYQSQFPENGNNRHTENMRHFLFSAYFVTPLLHALQYNNLIQNQKGAQQMYYWISELVTLGGMIIALIIGKNAWATSKRAWFPKLVAAGLGCMALGCLHVRPEMPIGRRSPQSCSWKF